MKKVRMARYSGLPIEPAHLEEYKKEFEVGYDQLAAKHGSDMLSLQTDLVALDKELEVKWNRASEASLPKTQKAWHALIAKFECPVMIAPSAEDPEVLVMMLMDMPLT